MSMPDEPARVLVVVDGGIASVHSEGHVVVEVYDVDDATDDPDYPPVGADFARLAQRAHIPHREVE